MAMQQWQSEHLTKFGAGKLDYFDYLSFQDKLGLLTANATTPSIMAFPNLTESGTLVLEIPAGPNAREAGSTVARPTASPCRRMFPSRSSGRSPRTTTRPAASSTRACSPVSYTHLTLPTIYSV